MALSRTLCKLFDIVQQKYLIGFVGNELCSCKINSAPNYSTCHRN